jgi:uncharacterized membrane protein YebE (DUF533 family)
MAEITYERLKNNIAEETVNGSQVSVTFKCPVTEKTHTATATMRASTGAGAKVKSRAKNEVIYAAKRGLRSLLRGVLGGGRAGSVAGNVAASSVPHGGSASYDKNSQQAAVVDAFRTVARNFAWNQEKQAYIDAETAEVTLSDFDRQLRDHPIEGKWERTVTARMLAEVANADGSVDEEEREFFESALDADLGSLDDLLKQGELSKFELEEVKPDARASMMMLACAMAMTDEVLDPKEQEVLARFAKGLGISLDREEQLRHWAAAKVVETMLEGCYEDGTLDDEERKRIGALATNIGINEGLVAKIDINIRKREGLG